MRYCVKCGANIPEYESAQFCPSCGSRLEVQTTYERRFKTRTKPYTSTNIGALRNRILVTFIVFVLCLAITIVGAISDIDTSEAQEITKEFSDLERILRYAGIQFIFGNNMMYCMIMFVPVFGSYYGSYVLYSTGRVIAAFSTTWGYNPIELFLTLFVYPHAWLEYISYSLAISESFWLVYVTIKNRSTGLRSEISTAAKIMAICAILLLLAAFAEMYVITST